MPRSQPRTCSRCRRGMAEWLAQLRCHVGAGMHRCVHMLQVCTQSSDWMLQSPQVRSSCCAHQLGSPVSINDVWGDTTLSMPGAAEPALPEGSVAYHCPQDQDKQGLGKPQGSPERRDGCCFRSSRQDG